MCLRDSPSLSCVQLFSQLAGTDSRESFLLCGSVVKCAESCFKLEFKDYRERRVSIICTGLVPQLSPYTTPPHPTPSHPARIGFHLSNVMKTELCKSDDHSNLYTNLCVLLDTPRYACIYYGAPSILESGVNAVSSCSSLLIMSKLCTMTDNCPGQSYRT